MKTANKWITALFAILVVLLAVVFIGFQDFPGSDPEIVFTKPSESALREPSPLEAFAEAHDLPISAWPEELLHLMEENPETEEFVRNFPLMKGDILPIDLEDLENAEEVPLLLTEKLLEEIMPLVPLLVSMLKPPLSSKYIFVTVELVKLLT